MLMLDAMRQEFARFLLDDAGGKWRMDKAFAHCVERAYACGMADGRAQVNIDELRALDDRVQAVTENHRAQRLLQRMLDPDDLGHAVTDEVRRLVRDTLGRTP